jgi:hypothetical protein
MTLADIKQKVRMVGLHHFGGKQDLDPFGLEYLILETANEIARRTDCLFGRRYLDLTAGQAEYCSPDVYRIRGVFLLDTTQDVYRRMLLMNFADRKVDRIREDNSQTSLDTAILYGMNKVGFFPNPTDAVTNGIMLEGYCQPGSIWQYDISGNPVSLSDSHECPLPNVSHDCLVYGVLAARAMQMMEPQVLAMYKAEYLERLGMVEGWAATYARRTV